MDSQYSSARGSLIPCIDCGHCQPSMASKTYKRGTAMASEYNRHARSIQLHEAARLLKVRVEDLHHHGTEQMPLLGAVPPKPKSQGCSRQYTLNMLEFMEYLRKIGRG